jgi:hypothetical protein
LASDPNVDPLVCSPAEPEPDSSVLEIPACEKERAYFFGSKTALMSLKKASLGKLPVCLLPTSKAFVAVDAIILTKDSIITIQVTISDKHSAKSGFDDVEEAGIRKGRSWCHVFITDNDRRAESLRGQTLGDLPKDISLHSAVFDIGRIYHEHLHAFDNKKVSGSWLHAIGAHRWITSDALAKKIVWTSTMSDSVGRTVVPPPWRCLRRFDATTCTWSRRVIVPFPVIARNRARSINPRDRHFAL